MVKVYYALINAGLRTIDQVPTMWRVQVQQMLAKDQQVITD